MEMMSKFYSVRIISVRMVQITIIYLHSKTNMFVFQKDSELISGEYDMACSRITFIGRF